ncbi:MAG: phosphodiesterase [Acidimicrobiales bacterium]|nr:phosphodiesterase [Acidimicrobiales bacterium]
MLIAQITDTHVSAPGVLTCGGAVDSTARFAAAIQQLNSLTPRPACVLITGDLADQGQPEEYEVFAELLDHIEIPVHCAIGNHDDRRVIVNALQLPAPLPGGWVQYCVDDYPVRLILLDSTSNVHHMAEFCEERLNWLRDRLAEQPDRPTVVAIHHPPFDTGIAFLDALGPGWAADLIALLGEHDNVELVVSGHVHRSIQTVVGGNLANICPSTAQQTTMDLAENPSADALFVLEPPAFQVHRVGEGPVVTHTVPVGDYEGVIKVTPEARAGWADGDPRVLLAKRDHHSPSA